MISAMSYVAMKLTVLVVATCQIEIRLLYYMHFTSVKSVYNITSQLWLNSATQYGIIHVHNNHNIQQNQYFKSLLIMNRRL